MTRRDYEAFAALVRGMPDWFDKGKSVRHADVQARLAVEIADLLMQEGSPRFNRQRFLAACSEGE